MATKKKIITLKIQPQHCLVEMERALESVGSFKGKDKKKGVVKGTYLYVFQTVKVKMALKSKNSHSVVQIVCETDDLIGTGGNKAIKKIEAYFQLKVPEYQIDYDIDDAFSAIVKGSFSVNEEVLKASFTRRADSFKVHFGLALCALNKKEEKKGLDFITRAIGTQKDLESKNNLRRKIASELWKLKYFSTGAIVYLPIGTNSTATREEQLFYLLFLLNSGEYGKLCVELVKAFPKNTDYAILISKDPGVLTSRKKEFISKTPVLLKGFRKKIVFNISPPNISYLLINKKKETPLKYKEALELYYKSKTISIPDFIKTYEVIKKTLISAESEAINFLRNDKTSFFKLFSEESKKIVILNELSTLIKNSTSIVGIYKVTLECASRLEKSRSFRDLYEAIKAAEDCNKKLLQVVIDSKQLFPFIIDDFLKKKKAKKAKEIISVFEKLYGGLPENNNVYLKKKKKIEEGNKRRLKVVLLIVASVIVLFTIVFGIMNLIKDSSQEDVDVQNEIYEKVTFEEGPELVEGYVKHEEKEVVENKLLIVGDDIWVRDAVIDGEVIMHLFDGNECVFLSKCCKQDIRGNEDYWYQIEYNGTMGWVFGSQTNQSMKSYESEISEVEMSDDYHTVRSGQSLYSIAKMYSLTLKEINKLNPQLVNGWISEGMSLKIREYEELSD